MAVYANSEVQFIYDKDQATLDAEIEAYIITLDTTTHPVIAIVPHRGGVLVVSGA